MAQAFLPAFFLSLLLAALALEHPTPMRQVLAIISIGLPVAIRAQGVVRGAVPRQLCHSDAVLSP